MTVLTAYAPLILAGVCGVILVGAGWLVFRWGYREGVFAVAIMILRRIDVLEARDVRFAMNIGSETQYRTDELRHVLALLKSGAHRKGDNA